MLVMHCTGNLHWANVMRCVHIVSNNYKLFLGIICSTYWWSDNWTPTWCCHIEEFTHIAMGEILVLDIIRHLYSCTHWIYCCCHCYFSWNRAIFMSVMQIKFALLSYFWSIQIIFVSLDNQWIILTQYIQMPAQYALVSLRNDMTLTRSQMFVNLKF